MAFDINNFQCGRSCYCTEGPMPDQVIHCYGSSDDTLATIIGIAYFNDAYTILSEQDKMRKGDMIAVKDSADDAQLYKITAVTADVTIAAL